MTGRITPAYAGTLGKTNILVLWFRDHPRIRGNTRFAYVRLRLYLGSPPHTREHSWQCLVCSDDAGITPAYAGTLSSAASDTRASEDHPRIRGNT